MYIGKQFSFSSSKNDEIEIYMWPIISIDLILGCGAINVPHTPNENNINDKAENNVKRGGSRLT